MLFFQRQFYSKIVDFSEIRTQIVRLEVEKADQLTMTTAQPVLKSSLTPEFKFDFILWERFHLCSRFYQTFFKISHLVFQFNFLLSFSVTRSGDLLDFGQLLYAFGNT